MGSAISDILQSLESLLLLVSLLWLMTLLFFSIPAVVGVFSFAEVLLSFCSW
jgi:hypothetical protein